MKKGYCLTAGSKLYFLQSDNTRKTKKLVIEFIDKYSRTKGLCDDFIERCKAHEQTVKEVQRRLDACTLELRHTGKIEYYHIEGSNYTENIPVVESGCLIIL